MKNLYLIRHGQTDALGLNAYCGSSDIDINEEGRQQLMALQKAGGYPDWQQCHVYVSGLKRTIQTLQIIYGDIPYDVLPAFKEIDFGDLEMVKEDDVINTPAFRPWDGTDSQTEPYPNGESWAQAIQRINSGVAYLLTKDEDAIVFTHGAISAALMDELFPEEKRGIGNWRIDCGRGFAIEFDGNKKPVSYHRLPVDPFDEWMDKQYPFVQNIACEFFPCHPVDKMLFNCLFCYCPLYCLGDQCGGQFSYTEQGIKDCSACTFPHQKNNYMEVIKRISAVTEMVRKKPKS